jgi:hypothetical protein
LSRASKRPVDVVWFLVDKVLEVPARYVMAPRLLSSPSMENPGIRFLIVVIGASLSLTAVGCVSPTGQASDDTGGNADTAALNDVLATAIYPSFDVVLDPLGPRGNGYSDLVADSECMSDESVPYATITCTTPWSPGTARVVAASDKKNTLDLHAPLFRLSSPVRVGNFYYLLTKDAQTTFELSHDGEFYVFRRASSAEHWERLRCQDRIQFGATVGLEAGPSGAAMLRAVGSDGFGYEKYTLSKCGVSSWGELAVVPAPTASLDQLPLTWEYRVEADAP